MLGGKLGQKFGSLNVFRMATMVLLIAMVMMTFSPNVTMMITAQLLAGLAAAAIVPSLVVLIANNYKRPTAIQSVGNFRRGAGHHHRHRLLPGRSPGHLDWLALRLRRHHSLYGDGAVSQFSPEASP